MTTLALPAPSRLADRLRALLYDAARRRHARRNALTLQALSDHQLRDIGLSRDQIADMSREAAGLRR